MRRKYGKVSPPPRVSDPDMHHGTFVTHMSWCMPGSLTSGFLWSRWRGKRSWHSRCMHNLHFTYLARGPTNLKAGWMLIELVVLTLFKKNRASDASFSDACCSKYHIITLNWNYEQEHRCICVQGRMLKRTTGINNSTWVCPCCQTNHIVKGKPLWPQNILYQPKIWNTHAYFVI